MTRAWFFVLTSIAVSRPRRRAPVRSRISAAAWHTRSLAETFSVLGACQIWEAPGRPSRWGAHRCSGYSPHCSRAAGSHPGAVRATAEQQLFGAAAPPQGQHDLLFGRLVDLVHPIPHRTVCDLPLQAVQKNTVQSHIYTVSTGFFWGAQINSTSGNACSNLSFKVIKAAYSVS